jgi:hypothetical protein
LARYIIKQTSIIKPKKSPRIDSGAPGAILLLFSSLWFLGIKENGRHYYWSLILWSIFKRPGLLPYAIGLLLGLLHFKTLAWAKQYNSYYRES